jgi:hypothetical protein
MLVHAAKRFIKDIDGPLRKVLDDEFGGHWAMDLPAGALIGVVNLIAIVPTETMPKEDTETDDVRCGDFGRFAWRHGVYRRFPEPIPYRGRQQIFDVPYSVVAKQIEAATEMVA